MSDIEIITEAIKILKDTKRMAKIKEALGSNISLRG